ncbi:MAG: hypothetical protein EBY83_07925 [Verrucomicrobia bacterium]|nr:hypothetical protein [Verrucomicrobiota bacterium]
MVLQQDLVFFQFHRTFCSMVVEIFWNLGRQPVLHLCLPVVVIRQHLLYQHHPLDSFFHLLLLHDSFQDSFSCHILSKTHQTFQIVLNDMDHFPIHICLLVVVMVFFHHFLFSKFSLQLFYFSWLLQEYSSQHLLYDLE